MRILITGPSSFTGAYFIEALSKAGHDVHATCTQSVTSYTGVRALRVQKAALHATVHEGIEFGDDAFIRLIMEQSFDVYCHHGAWTKDYRGMDYDFQHAFAVNTRSADRVCRLLSENGCRKIIVSGSIFEEANPVFSPYGLIKKLTTETFQLYGTHFGLHVSKFVIPNPFGPLDNPKLLDYLAREWHAGRVPRIQTPDYVRDNIPVDLLAMGFAHWVEECSEHKGTSAFRPSGYVSTMAEFVGRLSTEFRRRVHWNCEAEMAEQTDCSQPMTLVNDTALQPLFSEWDEEAFWNELVQHQIRLQS